MGIERASEFKEDPTGWAQRWTMEFSSAKKWIRKWHKQSDKVVERYVDNREKDSTDDLSTKLNLFNANITTLQSMLYGRMPKVEVDRRFADQDDDIARVASQILQRILNTDIESAGEDYSHVLRSALGDRLLVGLGTARVKYDFEEKQTEVPPQLDPITGEELAPGYTDTTVEDEWVDTVYTHWRDILWSPCRTYAEMRWRAYRAYLTRDELIARFGEELGKLIPLESKGPTYEKNRDSAREKEVWDQAEVWEIWDKTNKKVFWFVEGFDRILDMKDDPLGLDGFFPEPPSMMSNVTTSKYIPKADYVIAQDLYQQIDILETRISLLTSACKAVGVYDKANDGIQRVFMEGVENQLIPVDNWAAFAEKGGLKGVVDWVPIEQIAQVIQILTQKQNDMINQLYQVTGMADILRGAASQVGVSATEQTIKAKFASIRIQALQDEFARFASDLQRLKAEIIAKHYQVYCILEQSNIMSTPDAQMAQQAVELIKQPNASRWKIQVKPETLAMVDYAQLKQDRTEYINVLATFLQSAAPLVEMSSEAVPFLMQLMKWGLAGFKGSNEIEGVVDQAIAMFEQKLKQGGGEKPDPEQIKAQAEIQKAQLAMQKAQMDMQRDQMKFQMEMEQCKKEFEYKMIEMQTKHQLEMQKLQMSVAAERERQQAQTEANATERIIDATATKMEMGSQGKRSGGSKSNGRSKPKSP
jgi:hypothetical protein